MKRLLSLLFGCFLLLEASAQNPYVQQYQYNQNDFRERFKNKSVSIPRNDSSFVFHDFSLNARKPGVYRLPQDNMPCIVPDSTKTARIPNAWKGPVKVPYRSNPPRIPNLTKPWVPTPIGQTDQNKNADTK